MLLTSKSFCMYSAFVKRQFKSVALDGSDARDVGLPMKAVFGFVMSHQGDRFGVEVLDDRFMFFDLAEDPYEMKNLAGSDVHSDVAEELKSVALAFHQETPWLNIEPDSDDGELLSHD